MRLYERYRPTKFSHMVGQEKAIKQLEGLIGQGLGGQSLLFEGPSGSGKTTAALIVAREIGIVKTGETKQRLVQGTNLDLRFFGAGKMRADALDDLTMNWLHYYPMYSPLKMIVIDEAQSIRADTGQKLLSFMENLPDRVVLILTTTGTSNGDLFGYSSAFGSRCIHVHFESLTNHQIGTRLFQIAKAVTGDGAGLDYKAMLKQAGGNIRAAIQLLQDTLGQTGKWRCKNQPFETD